VNYELTVKEILKETFILTGKINNEQLIKNLIEFIKKNKDENLSYKTNVKGHFTGFKSLVQNNYFWTFLKKIQENIKIIYRDDFIISHAWGNICKIGEEVIEHDHRTITGFCGILYLTEGGPGTYFKEYDLLVKEEIGKYILFHPLLKHSVKKIENNIERITLAFDMNKKNSWEDYSQATWINKK
jgi:hypothetical protein